MKKICGIFYISVTIRKRQDYFNSENLFQDLIYLMLTMCIIIFHMESIYSCKKIITQPASMAK